MKSDFEKIAMKVSFVSIVANVMLSAFKLFAGIFAHSGAMVSDAVHSASDVFSTIVVIIGIRISGKKSDKEHPYGHERMECVAAIVLATILAVTGLGIGYGAVGKILSGDYANLEVPGFLALVAALVSIAVKEGMYWYTRHSAKKIDSSALMADAWHHRSDAFSSIGSLIGVGGAMLGWPVLDSLASVVICLFILKVAYDILKDALSKMLDTSRGEEYEAHLREYVLAQEDVLGVALLQSRTFGNRVYIDLVIQVDGELKLRDAHAIAERVHSCVERDFPDIKHIMIHVDPAEERDP